jgi:RimJ/RimL family protein N-acetyltransferase
MGEPASLCKVREVQIIARIATSTEFMPSSVFSDQWSLVTSRLDVRRARGGDAVAIAEFWRDPVERTYLGGEITAEESLRRVRARLDAGELFVVRLRDAPRVIGSINVASAGNGLLELSYLFVADVWRRGYATESLSGLLDALRAIHQGFRVRATTQVANAASRRLLACLGFSEGSLCVEFGEDQVNCEMVL